GVVLDVGCGYGKWGFLVWLHLFENRGKCTIVGVDVSSEYLKSARRLNVYEHLILADARNLPFKGRFADVSLVCEVVEHIGSKREGLRLLSEVERVTKRRVVVTTPRSNEAFFGSPDHVTKWEVGDFKRLGYKVRGVGLAALSWKKGRLASLLKHFVLKPLAYVIPRIGEYMVCVKELGRG
ncbi:TPA: class I SAM-dependent methyltransferase, partial [Candidatus Bathyarchaeota archaeon]|nr:class I SAM-dependent methyltransferase [Candidatus Bathyarchaeota archaeon]